MTLPALELELLDELATTLLLDEVEEILLEDDRRLDELEELDLIELELTDELETPQLPPTTP